MRRDAERNRDRLIEAGLKLIQEHGGDVAIERFCEAAGVNRATFYRHFPARFDLYSAICDHELDRMLRVIEATDDPINFLSALAEMMTTYDRFIASLSHLPELDQTEANDERVRASIAAPLLRAQEGGWIKSHITADDVVVIARMVGCGWRLDHQPSRSIAMQRRLRLVMEGLCPPRNA